jgi:homoserine O-acetyltransferase/O-succinyltransferase
MVPGPDTSLFTVKNFTLESGAVLPEARLAYRIDGVRDETPPILTVTAFSRVCDDLFWLSGSGGALDPARRWIIRTEMLGNGRSSSPSNAPSPFSGPDFPKISQRDNIRLQAALLDHLGVSKVAAVVGASMGGQQALQWATLFPERVGKVVAIVGMSRTTWHAQLFIRSGMEAVRGTPDFAGGHYTTEPVEALRRLSRLWAAWATSPRFFSRGLYQDYEDTAAPTLDAFIGKWQERYRGKDANDLLCQMQVWHDHDIAAGGDLAAVAAAIRTPILFLPSRTDAYFNFEDIADEARLFAHARCVVIPSDYGHAAGLGRSADDRAFCNAEIERFLAA